MKIKAIYAIATLLCLSTTQLSAQYAVMAPTDTTYNATTYYNDSIETVNNEVIETQEYENYEPADNYDSAVSNEEEFDEENFYDNTRDEEIEMLKQTVAELQASIQSSQETLQKTEKDTHNKSIWNNRAKYFNIYYVDQSLKQKNINGVWKNEIGIALALGKTFYLHKNPILGMIKFGIDWSYFDINFSKYKDQWGFFNGNYEYSASSGNYYDDYYYDDEDSSEDVYQAEIGTAIGVSLTINPYDHIKVSGHFRVIPSYSMLYADEDFSSSYGTFFSVGGAISYKVISVGIEGRWGNTKYNSFLNLSDIDDFDEWIEDGIDNISDGNYDGSSKWRTGSMRVYISFRF